jgi:GTP-binding protein
MERKEKAKALKKAAGRTPLILSAATHEGTEKALRALMEVIGEAREAESTEGTTVSSEGEK